MKNINTKEYWDKRFSSGEWNNIGQLQTTIYAKSNVEHINLDKNFSGTILDFGCAMGNAIMVYKEKFPLAKFMGIDISESAINYCKQKWNSDIQFICGEYNDVPQVDVIIASHVMEHITDDKKIVKSLLEKCHDLFIFVPYKETPLFIEHVNYYNENYYNEFNVVSTKVFSVSFKVKLPLYKVLTKMIRLKFSLYRHVITEVIMYHLTNSAKTV